MLCSHYRGVGIPAFLKGFQSRPTRSFLPEPFFEICVFSVFSIIEKTLVVLVFTLPHHFLEDLVLVFLTTKFLMNTVHENDAGEKSLMLLYYNVNIVHFILFLNIAKVYMKAVYIY